MSLAERFSLAIGYIDTWIYISTYPPILQVLKRFMLLWFEVIHKLKVSLPFVINSYSVVSIFSEFNLVMSSHANQRVQECVTCAGMTFWGWTRCSRKWFFVFLSCCYVSFSVLGCFYSRTYRKKTVWKKSIHCCFLYELMTSKCIMTIEEFL